MTSVNYEVFGAPTQILNKMELLKSFECNDLQIRAQTTFKSLIILHHNSYYYFLLEGFLPLESLSMFFPT